MIIIAIDYRTLVLLADARVQTIKNPSTKPAKKKAPQRERWSNKVSMRQFDYILNLPRLQDKESLWAEVWIRPNGGDRMRGGQ